MGYSTKEKLKHIKSWNVKPDFVSVNWFEKVPDILTRSLKEQNIEVEVGINALTSLNNWINSRYSDYYKRVPLEIPSFEKLQTIETETIKLYEQALKKIQKEKLLLHGEDNSCWPYYLMHYSAIYQQELAWKIH